MQIDLNNLNARGAGNGCPALPEMRLTPASVLTIVAGG